MNLTAITPIIAILAITSLEFYALRKGINGKGLLLAGVLIGIIAGVNMKDVLPFLAPGG